VYFHSRTKNLRCQFYIRVYIKKYIWKHSYYTFIIQSHLVAKDNKDIVQEMNKHIKNLFTFKVSCKTILSLCWV